MGEDKAKTLKLSTMERIILMEVIPARARIADAVFYAGLRKKLDLTDEEVSQVGLIRTEFAPGQFNVTCNDMDTRWAIEFTESELDRLVDLCRGYTNWPSTQTTVQLIGQLGDVSGKSLTT